MSRSRVIRSIGFAAVLACAGAVAFRSPAAPSRTHRVDIRGLAFRPDTVRIAPGDTIIWRNDDVVPHTVTPTDDTWDSGEVAPGGEFRRVVEGPGPLTYTCRYHPDMEGRVEPDLDARRVLDDRV